jgi:hypothetical protein
MAHLKLVVDHDPVDHLDSALTGAIVQRLRAAQFALLTIERENAKQYDLRRTIAHFQLIIEKLNAN